MQVNIYANLKTLSLNLRNKTVSDSILNSFLLMLICSFKESYFLLSISKLIFLYLIFVVFLLQAKEDAENPGQVMRAVAQKHCQESYRQDYKSYF